MFRRVCSTKREYRQHEVFLSPARTAKVYTVLHVEGSPRRDLLLQLVKTCYHATSGRSLPIPGRNKKDTSTRYVAELPQETVSTRLWHAAVGSGFVQTVTAVKKES